MRAKHNIKDIMQQFTITKCNLLKRISSFSIIYVCMYINYSTCEMFIEIFLNMLFKSRSFIDIRIILKVKDTHIS